MTATTLPPLPTAPFTVIRVTWRDPLDESPREFTLYPAVDPRGPEWHAPETSWFADQLPSQISGWKPVSTPQQTLNLDALLEALSDDGDPTDPAAHDRYSRVTALLQPVDGLTLLPEEIDIVAPALLEAGTRHLEKPGTAWQQLGHRVHAIAERLYEAIP